MAQLVNLATEDLGSILRTYVKKLSKVAHAYNPCTEEAEMGLLASLLGEFQANGGLYLKNRKEKVVILWPPHTCP